MYQMDAQPNIKIGILNFINLCHHMEDFGVPAEWHFLQHGKSAADGCAGTLATKASLQLDTTV